MLSARGLMSPFLSATTARGYRAISDEQIFEKFGQTNSGRQHRHSTGLGSPFAGLLSKRTKERLAFQSEPGKGSTFWFTIPTRDQSGVNYAGNTQRANFKRIG